MATTLLGPDGRSSLVDIVAETATSFVVREGDGEAEWPKTHWRRPVAHGEVVDRRALAAWFLEAEPNLTREPFELFPWVLVSDPERAYAAWCSALAAEPGARTDGVFRDLKRLRDLLVAGHTSSSKSA